MLKKIALSIKNVVSRVSGAVNKVCQDLVLEEYLQSRYNETNCQYTFQPQECYYNYTKDRQYIAIVPIRYWDEKKEVLDESIVVSGVSERYYEEPESHFQINPLDVDEEHLESLGMILNPEIDASYATKYHHCEDEE